eukprot:6278955-Amphidinium_carterae.1
MIITFGTGVPGWEVFDLMLHTTELNSENVVRACNPGDQDRSACQQHWRIWMAVPAEALLLVKRKA